MDKKQHGCEIRLYQQTAIYDASLPHTQVIDPEIATCPIDCPGAIEEAGSGILPRTTLICPIDNSELTLGRIASFIRGY